MQTPCDCPQQLLENLNPVLHDGVYVYALAPPDLALADCISHVREDEGVSVVITEEQALSLGLTPSFRAAWITLRVHSQLQDVGLTAWVSAALARSGISCNVVAGLHHDHLFVPIDSAESAMTCLRNLQSACSPHAAH